MIEKKPGGKWKLIPTGVIYQSRPEAEKAKQEYLAKKYAREAPPAPKKAAPRKKATADAAQA